MPRCRNVGSRMTRRSGSTKKMTLSEHLARRVKAAEESRVQEEERKRYAQKLKELDAMAVCNCPACIKLRRMSK